MSSGGNEASRQRNGDVVQRRRQGAVYRVVRSEQGKMVSIREKDEGKVPASEKQQNYNEP